MYALFFLVGGSSSCCYEKKNNRFIKMQVFFSFGRRRITENTGGKRVINNVGKTKGGSNTVFFCWGK